MCFLQPHTKSPRMVYFNLVYTKHRMQKLSADCKSRGEEVQSMSWPGLNEHCLLALRHKDSAWFTHQYEYAVLASPAISGFGLWNTYLWASFHREWYLNDSRLITNSFQIRTRERSLEWQSTWLHTCMSKTQGCTPCVASRNELTTHFRWNSSINCWQFTSAPNCNTSETSKKMLNETSVGSRQTVCIRVC